MITILHTGQTGVERGADHAARALGFRIRGYSTADQCDELGGLPNAITKDLRPVEGWGNRATWQPTLALATALVLVVPDASDAHAVAGVDVLEGLAERSGVAVAIVDPTSDFIAVARSLLRADRDPHVMIYGPRASRWPDGEALGQKLVTYLALTTNTRVYRILVVDDDVDTAVSMSSMLQMFGHHVETANSGNEALERAGELQPNIAFVDIRLPDTTGYVLARQLRDAVRTPLFIVAITGWDEARDSNRAFSAGFDQHILKPANTETIRMLVEVASDLLAATPA